MDIKEICFIDPTTNTRTVYDAKTLRREAEHLRKYANLARDGGTYYTLTIRGSATLAIFDSANFRGAGTCL